jgi:DNA (cytosine-5)-methyltransferase 1
MTTNVGPIPVIDLFAGPGGLCEGFSSLFDETGARRFDVRVSIEKDPVAHRTLLLRAIFRKFPKGRVPACYYDYVRGVITREQFLQHPDIREAGKAAAKEARCAELGKTPALEVDGWISAALDGAGDWVLIGGPPCQAYSLAGRSRRRPKDREAFEADARHFLYTEYLRIIQRFAPTMFVMENVKGMLNSKNKGTRIFERILSDLSSPTEGLKYRIRSLAVAKDQLEPEDFVVEADDHGVPQSRHRVLLFGIREDVATRIPALASSPERFVLRKSEAKVPLGAVLEGLPSLRSRLSREVDSHAAWLNAVAEAPDGLKGWRLSIRANIEERMQVARLMAIGHTSYGGAYLPGDGATPSSMPKELRSWLLDARLGGTLQHETRKHMRSDLCRYMFAACFAQCCNYAPNLRNFPARLLPDHENVAAETVPFVDRFRVQMANAPSSTIVAHIRKDGHYYIHPDPSQCRSLTVREAARLQTFPDNYYFEGNRTEQYEQVGNAVPPLLAHKIAQVVCKLISQPRVQDGATSGEGVSTVDGETSSSYDSLALSR